MAYIMSYANALKMAQCENVETATRKRKRRVHLFAGAIARQRVSWLPKRASDCWGNYVRGSNPGTRQAGQELDATPIVDGVHAFQAIN